MKSKTAPVTSLAAVVRTVEQGDWGSLDISSVDLAEEMLCDPVGFLKTASAPLSSSSSSLVDSLTAMGFPPNKAKQALALHNNNLDSALEYLLLA